MNIMYVIDTHPYDGGAPISTCLLATEMANNTKNNIFIILPMQSKNYEISEEININEIEGLREKFPLPFFHPLKTLKLINKLRKKIKELKPGLIHIHMPRGAWAIGFLKMLNFLPNKTKLIYTDRDEAGEYHWLAKLFSYVLIKLQYDQIICLTSRSRSFWENKKNLKVNVVPNSAGLLYEEFNNNLKDLRKYSDNFTIMFSGRMSPHKNWKLAEEIVNRLKYKKIFFIFAISTTNEEQYNSYIELKKSIEKYEVDHIFFNNLSQIDMAKLYYNTDVFILTSNKESFGRTAIEAMSRKCVVLGREVGGLPEVIKKKENILGDNPAEFEKRILYYKNNNVKLNEDKEWYFKRFKENYTVKINYELHKYVYNNLHT